MKPQALRNDDNSLLTYTAIELSSALTGPQLVS